MIRKILAGIDGSSRTRHLIDAAANLARSSGASLHILCAVDPGYFLDEPDGVRPTRVDEVDYPAAANEREGADALVRQAIIELRTRGLSSDGSVVAGEPVAAILKAAADLACDTIVLGHRHHSWLKRIAERSVCHELLERSSVPVLVIPGDLPETQQRSGDIPAPSHGAIWP